MTGKARGKEEEEDVDTYVMHILGSMKCVLIQFDIITNILY